MHKIIIGGRKVCFVAAILAMPALVLVGAANADYYGTGSGSGGSPTCAGPFSTCYGATWKWYDWTKARNNEYLEDGISAPDEGDGYGLKILGSTSGERQFIGAGKIDQDCSLRPGNGFWRYAMVAKNNYNYGASENYLQVYKDHQMGLLAIDQNANPNYDSEMYGGWTNYFEMEKSMDYVRTIYQKLKAEHQDFYPINWDENGTDGPLAWFCAPPDLTASYLSLSNVSNSKVGGYSTTGINDSTPVKVVYTADAVINQNEQVTIAFSHNIYADHSDDNVPWQITRTGFNGSGYSVVSQSLVGGTSGRANLTVSEDGYYVAENRQAENGGKKYLVRDQYTLRFNSTGQYLFCEAMSVGKDGLVTLTKVCTKVIVGGGVQPDTCGYGELAPHGTSRYNASSGITSVLSKVKNSRLGSTYRGWQDNVTYAMPGDMVAWQNCYFPGAQYYMNYGVTEWNGTEYASHGAHDVCYSTYTGTVTLYSVTDFDWISGYRATTTSPNGFNDLSGSVAVPLRRDIEFTYSAGNTTARGVANNYRIKNGDVGSSYNDYVSTNDRNGRRMSEPITSNVWSESHAWNVMCCSCNCPHHTVHYTCTSKTGGTYSCSSCVIDSCNCLHTYDHSPQYRNSTTMRGSDSDDSWVHVPYNYYNTITLDIDRSSVYAGDEIAVQNAYITVGTRYNDATEADYATVVPNARARLIGYVSTVSGGSEQVVRSDNLCGFLGAKAGLCNDNVNSFSDRLNISSNLNGVRTAVFNDTYSAFDASAGDYMCFAAAVFPATSGADTNYSDPNGDGMWRISAPKCARIVKKPSMQVLGGSVFSNGEMSTGLTKKYNLYGIYGHTGNLMGATYFGSWVEEGIIANGLVRNLASGAALGKNGTSTIYGLSTRSSTMSYNFCDNQVPLSFANFSASGFNWTMLCGNNGTAAGKANIHTNTAKNRTALVDYFLPGDPVGYASSNAMLDDYTGEPISSGTGKDIRYIYRSGNLTISGGNVSSMTTRIVKATGNVTIAGDIVSYGSELTSSVKVPKVVIYAAGDININCNVGRIDAILIAGGTVYTCSGYSTETQNALNSRERSLSQLVINGVVIANAIDPARTYGNAVGDKSGTPAEIINYDTSSLIWAHSMAEASESDTMTTVYQHELAPRY